LKHTNKNEDMMPTFTCDSCTFDKPLDQLNTITIDPYGRKSHYHYELCDFCLDQLDEFIKTSS